MKFFLFIITVFSLINVSTFAGEGVAKVIILKGKAYSTLNGKKVPMKKGMWLPEGAEVSTEAKSFTKLLFIDKSSMNVGPKSTMKITAFPKKDAGIITLIKGQIRSKVTKNYMDMKKKDKSKLFIKTKSAAMGVRGTDFQVNYNPENGATSLVTFHGAVAMARFESMADNIRPPTQADLERTVSSDQAVIVMKGQYSGASPKMQRATLPVKISPVQLETLRNNEVSSLKQETRKAPGKSFRSVLPPGVDGKKFANDNKEMDKEMFTSVGRSTMNEIKEEIKQELSGVEGSASAEGMMNSETGEVAPTAGGYVDLGTAQYIPPPPGSAYDPNQDVYIPPPTMGRIDLATGDFVNDHYELQPDGTFVAKEIINEDGRAPADAQSPPPPPPETITLDGGGLIDGTMDPFAEGGSSDFMDDPCATGICDEVVDNIEQDLVDDLNNPVDTGGATTANFEITIN
ncbi:FecR family protein [Bacteriovoracaceae bacterium]|nr:FecR family protein [Bacteriovoracaceae bacterium]